jgi:hypothetical protein
MKGFRFNLCTKVQFSPPSPHEKKSPSTIDFESIFWNNLFYLNDKLKRSIEYTTHNMMKIQQAIHSSTASSSSGSIRSRSKSISRTTSIPSIGKLFSSSSHTNIGNSNNDDHGNTTTDIRSRSVSPSKIKKSKSFSPPITSQQRISQYSSSNHSNSSATTISSSSSTSSSPSSSPEHMVKRHLCYTQMILIK